MAITSLDTLINALANNGQLLVMNKASLLNTVAGQFFSLWQAAGIPAAGATPTAAETPTRTTLGGLPWTAPTGGNLSYLGRMFAAMGVAGNDIQIHDRIGHMGGLSGTNTGAQTVGVTVAGSGSNMVARRGAADYSDVQWWMEWYTATGSSTPTFTVTYTNAAGTSGRTVVIASQGATIRAGRMVPIAGSGGEYIQSIQSIQLSATTGTVGNFGVTASRALTSISLGTASWGQTYDFQRLGLPQVQDDACLMLLCVCGTITTGALYGSAKLIQG